MAAKFRILRPGKFTLPFDSRSELAEFWNNQGRFEAGATAEYWAGEVWLVLRRVSL